MNWFAVRSVYSHGEEADGKTLYEERTVLFRADSAEEAFEMADVETSQYLQLNPTFRRVGQPGAYMLGTKEGDLHGTEVWSVLGASTLAPEDYFRRHYVDIELQPDESDGEIGQGPAA